MLGRGFSIGRVFGIDVRLDPSLIIIFLLIAVSLAVGLFPAWHPDWSVWLNWGVALAAGVLFLASVLLHELAHSVVAKAYGLPVKTITLYLFGGMANVEEEPKRPGIEFLMAAVGPLTSIGLGLIFTVAAGLLAGPADPGADPALFAQQLDPLATLLAWLGPVNLLLGVFNLLPGFPLDGGRMLRAGLWKATGDFVKATRWAAGAGRTLGWLLILTGVAMALGVQVPILGTGLVSGLWLALIGWFLTRLASWSYQRTVLERALEQVHASDVMARNLQTLEPGLTVEHFAEELGQQDQLSWPVVFGDRLLGVVRLEDLDRLPRERWAATRVADIMVPADQLPSARPGDSATDVLRKLAQSPADHVAVEEGGHLRGLVRQPDILRWLRLHGRELAPR